MRDGVALSADIYHPQPPISNLQSTNLQSSSLQSPALLLRTPYVKASQSNVDLAKYFARNGYVVVFMDVRGRGDSDGQFVPYRNEGRDGYDAVEWCAAQPWSS